MRGEVHAADDIGAGIGILEAHVTEGELTARRADRGQFGRDRVVDAGGASDDLFHALGGDLGAGQDDRNHGEDHKRHDDLHGVGDKRHHVADLHHAVGHALRAKPDDKHGDAVHDEHHERHHKAHGAVGVELRGHQVERCLVKALELMFLAVERADGHKAVEQLAGGKVHAVHKALHLFELGHGEAHEHADNGRNRDDGHGDGPLQTGVVGQDAHDGDDAHDGGHQAHADKQGCGHLDLLNIVGAAGDERGLAKLAHLGRREVHNLVEGLATQVAGDGAGGARRHGTGQNGGDERHQAQPKHRGRHVAQVGVLHVGGVDALCLVLVLYIAHGALGDDGARHGAHFVRHLVGALDELALVYQTALDTQAQALHGDLTAVGIDLLLHVLRRCGLLLHLGELLGRHRCHLLGDGHGLGSVVVFLAGRAHHVAHGVGVNALVERKDDSLGQAHNVGNLASIGTLFLGTLIRSNAIFVSLAKHGLHSFGVLGAHKEFKVVERFGADGVGYGRGDAALLHTHVDDVAHIGRQRQIGVAADYDKHDSCEQCQDMFFKELENPHSASLLS